MQKVMEVIKATKASLKGKLVRLRTLARRLKLGGLEAEVVALSTRVEGVLRKPRPSAIEVLHDEFVELYSLLVKSALTGANPPEVEAEVLALVDEIINLLDDLAYLLYEAGMD